MSKYGETESIGGGVYAQAMPGGGVNIMANSPDANPLWLDKHNVKSLIELLERVIQVDNGCLCVEYPRIIYVGCPVHPSNLIPQRIIKKCSEK